MRTSLVGVGKDVCISIYGEAASLSKYSDLPVFFAIRYYSLV